MIKQFKVFAQFILVIMIVAMMPSHLLAAEGKGTTTIELTTGILDNKIKEAEASKSLDESTRQKLVELYQKALTYLEKKESHAANTENFRQTQQKAPAEVKKLQAQLAQEKRSATQAFTIDAQTPLAKLEEQLQRDKTQLIALQTRLSEFNKQLDSLENRPTEARERLIAASRQRETISTESAAAPPSTELAQITQARKWMLQSHSQALSAEIKMLELELLVHQVRMQELGAKRDLAEQQLKVMTAEVRQLEDHINSRRLVEAEKAINQTQAISAELKDKHPVIRGLAEKNLRLGEEIRAKTLLLEQVAAQDDKVRKNSQRIAEEFSTVKQKLQIAGLTQRLGQILAVQRRALPQVATLTRENEAREQEIANSNLLKIQYSEERRNLRDMEAYSKTITSQLSEEELQNTDISIKQLLSNRLELLDKAISTENSYLRAMGELDLAQRQLVGVVKDYDQYLGKRLLWIRSTDPVTPTYFKNLPLEISRFFSLSSWLHTTGNLLNQLVSNPLEAMMVFALAGLVLSRRKFLHLIEISGKKVGRVRTDSFKYTLQAMGWSLLASLPLPLLVLMTGWQLTLVLETDQFSKAVAAGLMRAGFYFLFLQFFIDVLLPGGLADRHFRWSAESVHKLRQELKLLAVLFLPSVFIVIHGFVIERHQQASGLLMLAVLVAIGSITFFLYRILLPQGGVLKATLDSRPQAFFSRIRMAWISLLLIIMISLLISTLMGYMYTAGTLSRDLMYTLWMAFILVIIRGLVIRWLLLVRRKLALQAALERRAAAQAAKQEEEKAEGKFSAINETLEIEEPEVDLATLDAESRSLLNNTLWILAAIGLWFIWSPVLPALGILDTIALWDQTTIVDGVETLAPVTLADLALAMIIGIVTASAAKGLPAILEFVLLQRISISAGSRYTATTLLRYIIYGVGITLFFTILGGKWSQIQWLVAALGVGIGFGLQEIVANFISGLIILFERPIRVGDFVTVGDVSGVVSRIEIRATTITNWDRQELLVPNKEFITNRLLNWSLSDPIIRIKIPIGIAYGSDVALAMKLIKEAAEEHSNVLSEPEPSVTFESFGDNSLALYLVGFLPSIENRIKTITELHQSVNDKFNNAGIVIAFPQRDVHLDTSQPININIQRDTDL